MVNYIIIAVIAAAIVLAGYGICKNKKSGRSCSGCPCSGSCNGSCGDGDKR